jgi:transposase
VGAEERIAELEALVSRLEATVVALTGALAERDARIAELEERLGEARRAGKRQAAPFSKGAPKLDPDDPGRKKGKAHGRHGHRAVPLGPPDRDLAAPLPGCCPDCGGTVDHVRDVEQWQVDLPARRAVTTRFTVGVGRCRDCGRRVQGRHPEQTSDALGAAASQVGPHAKAFATWLHYRLGLSFGRCAELLGHLGITITAGALCQAAQQTGTALVPGHAELVKRANDAAVTVMDETGWKVGGIGAWLWVATNPQVTIYTVADGRGFTQACDLINETYTGTIVRDGWSAYPCYREATHQTCLAHLLRRCHHLVDDLPAWARATPRIVGEVLKEALDARDLDDDKRAAVVIDLAERIDLLTGQSQPHDECRKLVAHLAKERDALFRFLTEPGVDATNWRAEQAIRPAVVNRKTWGGNRTWAGAATQSRIMSALVTARQNGIDAIDYLTTLARAGPHPAALPLHS